MKKNEIELTVGLDLTNLLQITNYVKQQENADEEAQAARKSRVPRFLMDMAWFRWIYFKLFSLDKGWPVFIQKTDECRIQVCAKILMEHYNEDWEITEKSDGTSATYFTYFKRVWGLSCKSFGVCSRNIWQKKQIASSCYWAMAIKYNLADILKNRNGLLVLQGEIIGPTIQKNKYNRTDKELLVFNLIENGVRQSYASMKTFCELFGLTPVPLIKETFNPVKEIGEGKAVMDVVRFMVALSKGKSLLADRQREGIVVRLKSKPEISFKVINPDFLLTEDDQDLTNYN